MNHRDLPSSTRVSERGLQREHRRLHRAFATLVFALAPAALAQACDPPAAPRIPADFEAGAGAEASVDAGSSADAGADAPLLSDADADAAPLVDAQPDVPVSCTLVAALGDAGGDAEPICFYTLPCGLPKGLVVLGCDLYTTSADAAIPFGCSLVDGQGCEADAYTPGPGGVVTMMCPGCLGGGGRRPRGLARPRSLPARTSLGAYFARMAHDEAASVHAFLRMRDELALHGAPPALVRAAARSARDEERHARAMARYARLHGAPVPAPRVRRAGTRSLEAIARENAVEGCVHETFGALLLHWQAAHAHDASVRRTFARLSVDETRHAALSWAVARWVEARLDPAARARVLSARARALTALRRPPPGSSSSSDAPVGRPDPGARAALLEGMIERLEQLTAERAGAVGAAPRA